MIRKYFFLLLFFCSCSPVIPINKPSDHPAENLASKTQGENQTLSIIVMDIGQGDGTLIIGPSGKTILIDGGPAGAGISKVLPTLQRKEVSQLHWIIASHYDADHISAIPEIIKGEDQLLGTEDDRVPVLGLIDRGDQTDKNTSTYKEYLQIAAPFRHEAAPGMHFDLGGGAHADVVVVNGNYEDGRIIHLNPDEENEAAIGLLVEYGNFKYFTAGDLTGGGNPGGFETKDMESTTGEIVGHIDILHVGHHGSASSSNEHFLDLVQPVAAVISVGRHNDYGHPAATTLHRLEKVGADIYRTDQMGTMEISTQGKGYDIRINQ